MSIPLGLTPLPSPCAGLLFTTTTALSGIVQHTHARTHTTLTFPVPAPLPLCSVAEQGIAR